MAPLAPPGYAYVPNAGSQPAKRYRAVNQLVPGCEIIKGTLVVILLAFRVCDWSTLPMKAILRA